MFLVCSKGPHISVFCTHLMNGGSLSKPIEHVISGVHLLNVTALTISSSGTLYTTSAEGTVQQYKLGKEIASCYTIGHSEFLWTQGLISQIIFPCVCPSMAEYCF